MNLFNRIKLWFFYGVPFKEMIYPEFPPVNKLLRCPDRSILICGYENQKYDRIPDTDYMVERGTQINTAAMNFYLMAAPRFNVSVPVWEPIQ